MKYIKMFPCSCRTEGLTVEYWPEDKLFSLTLFHNRERRLPFWEQVKMIWKIASGRPIEWNNVILDKVVAKRFAREIIKLSRKDIQPGEETDETTEG